ncbi:glycoside hydrolase superfamily [Aspergillus pseudodeflectus]|uniref:Probable beta-glucosidase G n=1 Tax=Aspergillus pseudodeflectus TaxID=176178 RepID=A0ABR4JPN8_9EURO
MPLIAWSLVSILQLTLAVRGQSSTGAVNNSASPPTQDTNEPRSALEATNNFISSLTLAEKAQLVAGSDGPCGGSIAPIPRLGFGGLCLSDSPLGVRDTDFVTMFSAGITTGATFDRALIHERAVLMAEEFRAKGVHIALSPVAGPIGRAVRGGRNWEGFGADPYLAAVGCRETIAGFNSVGVQSTIKHWIGNEQETMRNLIISESDGAIVQDAISFNIDDRTMHEIYMWPFAEGIRAGASHVMCSYQQLNETYSCENSKSLNGLLKGELGFQGAVMSDWLATHSGIPSIKAGLDLNMPGSKLSPYFANVTNWVADGIIPEERLDDMVRRIFIPYFEFQQDTDAYPSIDPSFNEWKSKSSVSAWFPPVPPGTESQWKMGAPAHRDVRKDHGEFVRILGAAGSVLLKNTGVLPLKNVSNIFVAGNDAADLSHGQVGTDFSDSQGPEFGANAQPGGSGTGRFSTFVSPLEAIKARMGSGLTQYILDNKVIAGQNINSVFPLPEVCLVFVKSYQTEASDRLSLSFDWNGTTVINTVAAACNNTIVITHSGGANLMEWADHPNITAIIAAHLPGQEIGNSIVDILWGDVNPSGKLPYTIAHLESDYNAPIVNLTNATDKNAWQDNFAEHLLIDYRHFDAHNITPRYEFGYGLSYTTFSLGHVFVSKSHQGEQSAFAKPAPTRPGGNPRLYEELATVHATVCNTGRVSGAAVPQFYLSFPPSSPEGTPLRVLRGFNKTTALAPGKCENVDFVLTRKDVSYWDTAASDWHLPKGQFIVNLGFSSRDLVASNKISFR